VKAGDEK